MPLHFTSITMRKMMCIDKTKYQSANARGLLSCTYRSSVRGQSSKFTKDDAIRNVLFTELISCGLAHTKSAKIAREAVLEKDNILVEQLTVELGSVCVLTVPMKPIHERILYEECV